MQKYLMVVLIVLMCKMVNGQETPAPFSKIDSTAQSSTDGVNTDAKLQKKRSRESIKNVVIKKVPTLKKMYNKRLQEKSGLNGKIVTKFAIDEFGKVIFCQIAESSINDTVFENRLISEVKSWDFGAIDKPGDVTEVVYPFVFNSGGALIVLGCVLVIISFVLSLSLLKQ